MIEIREAVTKARGLGFVALLAIAAVVARAELAAAQEAAGTVALTHVNVVPMDSERVIPDATVVLVDGRITQVGSAAEVAVPAGAREFNLTGKYVVPGLMDMHVHLGFPTLESTEAHRLMSLFLRFGVTTVRNMHGTPAHVALRDSVSSGAVMGPTIVTAGPMFRGVYAASEEAARAGVREFAAAGYNAIKIVRLPPEIFAAVVSEAAEVGLPVVGHLPNFDMPFSEIAAAGMLSIEHTNEILSSAFGGVPDRSRIPEVAQMILDAGPTVSTILGGDVTRAQVRSEGEAFLTSERARLIEEYVGPEGLASVRRSLADPQAGAGQPPFERAFLLELVRAFDEAGVPVVVGTDSRTATEVPGLALHEELALFREGGMTPYRALRTVTTNAAALLGIADTKGRIAPGYDADLVVVDANPLDGLDTLKDPRAVVRKGIWLDRETLDYHMRRQRGGGG